MDEKSGHSQISDEHQHESCGHSDRTTIVPDGQQYSGTPSGHVSSVSKSNDEDVIVVDWDGPDDPENPLK